MLADRTQDRPSNALGVMLSEISNGSVDFSRGQSSFGRRGGACSARGRNSSENVGHLPPRNPIGLFMDSTGLVNR